MFVTEDPIQNSNAQFEFPWETLQALFQGRSAIDLSSLPVQDRDEAYEMILSYGFDLNRDEDALEIQGCLVEAIHFIERRFLSAETDWEALGELPAPSEKIPEEVTGTRDVLDLILMSSDAEHPMRPWACAILRVMHTLVFLQNSPLYKYQTLASEAIISRFEKVVHQREDGTYVLLGRDRELALYGFEKKEQKPRESILLKLLCKKENVAESIWDLVGLRLVTNHPAEAVLAVDILREQKVILLPTVIPGRTRNTLIDFDQFYETYQKTISELPPEQRSLETLRQVFEQLPAQGPDSADFSYNPLSSPLYRSLHITCRQLLRVKPPGATSEMRLAFPYEIQIQDKESFLENRDGHSAHGLYKQRQLIAARRRVLGMLLKPEAGEVPDVHPAVISSLTIPAE